MTRPVPTYAKVGVGADWPWLEVRNAAGELERAVVECNTAEGWIERIPTDPDGRLLHRHPTERVEGQFTMAWREGAPQS